MRTALFVGVLLAGLSVACAALPSRWTEIALGGGAGLLLGLVGHLFAVRIAARQREQPDVACGKRDIWGLWAAGLLARLVLLGVITGGFWFLRHGMDFPAVMLALAAVYLSLLFWETAWLYRRIIGDVRDRSAHG